MSLLNFPGLWNHISQLIVNWSEYLLINWNFIVERYRENELDQLTRFTGDKSSFIANEVKEPTLSFIRMRLLLSANDKYSEMPMNVINYKGDPVRVDET